MFQRKGGSAAYIFNVDMKTKIVYEDRSVLVCRKPAGLATQTASGFQEDMVSELKNYLSGKAGEKNPYLGLIHRLDQPVEGLLVFGKTKNAAAALTGQLSGGRLRKQYLAVLEGVLEEKEGVLVDYLKKDGRSNLSAVVPKGDSAAKRAELSYRLLAAHEDCCLAQIEIATGRHHQIRVQTAHAGHPLRNDYKYGAWEARGYHETGRMSAPQEYFASPSGFAAQKRPTPQKEPAQQGGLALCAYALSFEHPADGRRMSFTVRPENPAFAEFETEINKLQS